MASVLVIDDDEECRIHLTTLLRQAGHTVMEAPDGLSGLQGIQSGSVDLIITDIFMPARDGFQLLDELTRIHSSVKVIAISGGYRSMSPHVTLQIARHLGAVDTIVKPFQKEEVLRQVAITLGSANTVRNGSSG